MSMFRIDCWCDEARYADGARPDASLYVDGGLAAWTQMKASETFAIVKAEACMILDSVEAVAAALDDATDGRAGIAALLARKTAALPDHMCRVPWHGVDWSAIPKPKGRRF